MGGDESFRIIPSPLARNKNFPGTRLNFYAFLRTFSLLSSSPSSSSQTLHSCSRWLRKVSAASRFPFFLFFPPGEKG